MAVYVGSARIDENGKAYGGAMANCVWLLTCCRMRGRTERTRGNG